MDKGTKKKTFSKKFWDKVITIILVLFGGILSLVGGLLAQQCSYNNALELQKKNLRESSYIQLSGLQNTIQQQYATRLEAITYFYYHQYKYFNNYSDKDIEEEEMKRYELRCEEYVEIIKQPWQEIYNNLAEIKISFDITPEIDNLIKSIINHGDPVKQLENPVDGGVQFSINDLENWRVQTISNIHNGEYFQYNEPIQQLLTELEKQLN